MDRKPALTKKIIRGFNKIGGWASADLETTLSDEVPSVTKEEADDIGTALQWMTRIEMYYKRKQKAIAEKRRIQNTGNRGIIENGVGGW